MARPKRQANGRWGGKITYQRRQYWVGTFDTPREWELAAAKLLADLNAAAEQSEINAKHRTMTVREFVEAGWPRTHTSRRSKESTFRTYEYSAKLLVRAFGDRPLRGGIGRAEARSWATRASANTVWVARSLFNDAIEDELATVNPFAQLRLPAKLGRRDITTISRAEFDVLCDVPLSLWPGEFGEIMRAFVRFQGETAMRPGETAALRWSSVDFERDRIRVLLQLTGSNVETLPKVRQVEVVLPPRVKDALLSMPRLDDEFVFRALQGGPLTKSSLHFYWDRIRAAFLTLLPEGHWLRVRTMRGKPYNLYELRHYAATWLLESPPHGLGLTPFEVAQQLGHTDRGIRVTKLYGHPDERRARERLAEAYRRDAETPADVNADVTEST